jgi:hypothetical protein
MLHSFKEKRRHLRVEFKVPVKISGDHGDILTETKNLSCSGAFCRMDQRLEPMTRLRVYLLLPLQKSNKPATKKVSCQGVVVRTQEAGQEFESAIFFNDIAPKDAHTISDFVESKLESRQR